MKRFLSSVLLVLFMLVTLSAKPLVISLLGAGLDALDTHDGIVVDVKGEQVYLGGSTLGALKKTFRTHDFLQLPFDQRSELYESAQLSITWPVFKNLLVGFGSGSRLQGDLGGQLFGQIADWGAATTIGVGLGVYLIDFLFIQMFSALNSTSSSYDDPMKDFALGTIAVGAIFLLAERVVQAILPIPYGLRYNKALRTGLGVNKDGSDRISPRFALTPTVAMNQDQGVVLQVVGKVSIAL